MVLSISSNSDHKSCFSRGRSNIDSIHIQKIKIKMGVGRTDPVPTAETHSTFRHCSSKFASNRMPSKHFVCPSANQFIALTSLVAHNIRAIPASNMTFAPFQQQTLHIQIGMCSHIQYVIALWISHNVDSQSVESAITTSLSHSSSLSRNINSDATL
jgi:hypothetical protein